MSLIIALKVLAALLVFFEILIPSAGILTILAVGALGGSWYLITQTADVSIPLMVGLDLVLLISSIWLSLKIFRKTGMIMKDTMKNDDGYHIASENKGLVGQTGVTIDEFRPLGHFKIGEEILEGISETGYLEKNQKIKIIAIRDNKYILIPDAQEDK